MVHGCTGEPSPHFVPADEIYLGRSRDKAPNTPHPTHTHPFQASAASGASRRFTTLFGKNPDGGRRRISIQGRTFPSGQKSARSFPADSGMPSSAAVDLALQLRRRALKRLQLLCRIRFVKATPSFRLRGQRDAIFQA